MRTRDEGGVAVVLVLALVAGLMAIAGVGVAFAAAVVVHRKAQSAADLAALAAAQSLQVGGDPCTSARRIAEENGATVDLCAVEGSSVTVAVAVPLPVALGSRHLRARARAGPAQGDPSHLG